MSAKHEAIRLIRVFVSSPGDVSKERETLDEVITSINDVIGKRRGVRLEAWKWEDQVVPQIGPSPQAVVDAQLPTYDIYLGIMASRFGTPTERYGSGTEKEFRDALARWGEEGAPWILFYFHDNPPPSKKPAVCEEKKPASLKMPCSISNNWCFDSLKNPSHPKISQNRPSLPVRHCRKATTPGCKNNARISICWDCASSRARPSGSTMSMCR
jgi:hypothetical protein